jgi:hypothetical protein
MIQQHFQIDAQIQRARAARIPSIRSGPQRIRSRHVAREDRRCANGHDVYKAGEPGDRFFD